MTQRSWTMRPLTPDDRDGSLDLFRRVFGEEDASRAWWEWKYRQNPAGPAIGYVAEAGTKIVGQYVLFPHRFQCGGRPILAAHSADTMVDPEFQRQGIFRELVRMTLPVATSAGIDLVYFTPNGNSQPGFTSLPGYRDILPWAPVWLKPVSLAPLAAAIPGIGSKVYRPASAMESALQKMVGIRHSQPADIHVIDAVPADRALTAVAEHAARRRTLAAVRDARYFAWRYTSRPHRSYKAVVAFGGEEPVGYAVFSTLTVLGLLVGFVAELDVCSEDMAGVGRLLLSAAVERLRKSGAVAISSFTMPDSYESRMLRQAQFLRCPRRLMPRPMFLGCLILGQDASVCDALSRTKSWYFSWGDHDVV